MKLLWVSPYPLYPCDSGGRLRIWAALRFLSQRHSVTLVTFAGSDPVGEAEWYRRVCQEAILVPYAGIRAEDLPLHGTLPWLIRPYVTDQMWQTLLGLSHREYEVVLLEHSFLAPYRSLFECPVVLSEQNIESHILQQAIALSPTPQAQLAARGRWLHLHTYENKIWPQFPLRVTVSDLDRAEMNRRCPEGETLVIPNGIDLADYQYLAQLTSAPRILFMGTLEYGPNLDGISYFLVEIWPLLRHLLPEVRLIIAGKNPPPQLAADHPQVEVIANPVDMQAVAHTCQIMIVPLRLGSGSRLKILHAMAMGIPVVSTPLGCAGLDLLAGRHLWVAEEPLAFATAVAQLLQDSNRSETLRQLARQWVERHHTWQQLLPKLESGLADLLLRPGLAKPR